MAGLKWKDQGLTDSELLVNLNKLSLDKTFKSVDLRSNSLHTMPHFNQFMQFQHVESLDLSRNNLVKVNIENLPCAVRVLRMSTNLVSELDDISKCHTLEQLLLAKNGIKSFNPDHLPANIEWLHMSENQITDMPDISQCQRLRGVYLSDNNISELDPQKFPLNIERLHLRNNKLAEVKDFSQHKKLRALDLRGNEIVKIYEANRDMSSWRVDTFHENFFQKEHSYQHLTDSHLPTRWLSQPPQEVSTRGLQSVIIYFKDMVLSKRVRHSRKR